MKSISQPTIETYLQAVRAAMPRLSPAVATVTLLGDPTHKDRLDIVGQDEGDLHSEVIYCTVRFRNGDIIHVTSGGQFTDAGHNARFRLVIEVSKEDAAKSKEEAAKKELTQDEKYGRVVFAENSTSIFDLLSASAFHYNKVVFMVSVKPLCDVLMKTSPSFAKALLTNVFVECTAFPGNGWKKNTLFDFDDDGHIMYIQAFVIEVDGGFLTLPTVAQSSMKLCPVSQHVGWKPFLVALSTDASSGDVSNPAYQAFCLTEVGRDFIIADSQTVGMVIKTIRETETVSAQLSAIRDFWARPCEAIHRMPEWQQLIQTQTTHPFLTLMGQKRVAIGIVGKAINAFATNCNGSIWAVQGCPNLGAEADSKPMCGTEDAAVIALNVLSTQLDTQSTRNFWEERDAGTSHPLISASSLSDSTAVTVYEDNLVICMLQMLLAYKTHHVQMCSGLFPGMKPPCPTPVMTRILEFLKSDSNRLYLHTKTYLDILSQHEVDTITGKMSGAPDLFEAALLNHLYLRFGGQAE